MRVPHEDTARGLTCVIRIPKEEKKEQRSKIRKYIAENFHVEVKKQNKVDKYGLARLLGSPESEQQRT